MKMKSLFMCFGGSQKSKQSKQAAPPSVPRRGQPGDTHRTMDTAASPTQSPRDSPVRLSDPEQRHLQGDTGKDFFSGRRRTELGYEEEEESKKYTSENIQPNLLPRECEPPAPKRAAIPHPVETPEDTGMGVEEETKTDSGQGDDNRADHHYTKASKKPEGGKKTRNGQRRRGLRKRMRSRGHGTLNKADLEHAKSVDVNQIDLGSESINKEFGTFGALPVGSKKLWDTSVKVSQGGTPEVYSTDLQTGTYKYILKLRNSTSSRLLLDFKPVLVKVWLINKQFGHSKVTCSGCLCSETGILEFDLVVRERDCKGQPMELRTQLISEARFSTAKVSVQLHKVNLVDPDMLDCSANFQLKDLVLDGEDQSDMIRKTRVERAKSARLKKQQRQLRKTTVK